MIYNKAQLITAQRLPDCFTSIAILYNICILIQNNQAMPIVVLWKTYNSSA